MVDIYCQTDFDGDTRARIEVISSDTPNTSEVVATPPSGKTYQYPVAAHGNFLCYELPAGENVNVHAANANVVVNGTKRLRPMIAPPRFLDFTTTTWGPAGHATILPNDKLVHHARIEKRLFNVIPFGAQEWHMVETDLTLSAASHRVVGVKDHVEPSADPTGRLTYINKADDRASYHKVVANGVTIATPGLAFDPVVSPNGLYVAWLVLEAAAGSTGLQNIFNVNWALYTATLSSPDATRVAAVPAVTWDLITHPFWLDDDTLLFSKYSWWKWRLRTAPRTGGTQAWLTDTSKSIGMAYPAHT